MNVKRNEPHIQNELACCICGSNKDLACTSQGAYVCEDCADNCRQGRDVTTQALRVKQRANRAARSLQLHPDEGSSAVSEHLEFVSSAGDLLTTDALSTPVKCLPLAGGELAKQNAESATTLTASIVALDASNERIQLVSNLGNDIAALALDTAGAVGADNSVEQILAHQIAAAHHQAMTLLTKAAMEPDPAHQIRLSNLAAKWMAVTQSASLTVKKLKASGEQRITIQHVNVSDGGQAVIGEVRAGGSQCKT